MGVIQPGRALIVEIRQRPLFQLGGVFGLGNDAVGITGYDFGNPIHPLRGIQPVLAQLVQLAGGVGNGLGAGIDRRSRAAGMLGSGRSGKGKVSKHSGARCKQGRCLPHASYKSPMTTSS